MFFRRPMEKEQLIHHSVKIKSKHKKLRNRNFATSDDVGKLLAGKAKLL